ncbi:hypothetical protein ABZX30_00440 [Streptomyces sp. NPDC004542]|uniref:hypothetical protein n=1 Tax=Streptomyces sp. NPDC004542 TaxID=3154281 RepID=UPI00339DC301
MTDTGAHTSTGSAPPTAPLVRRGRHRKPRPRRAVLAAGGLVLAAGALSLVRTAPDSGAGAPGTAEAELRLDAGGAAGRPAHTAGPGGAAPGTQPSATSAMGGAGGSPTPSGAASSTALPASAPAAPTPHPANAATALPLRAPTRANAPARGPAPGPSRTHAGPAPAHTHAPPPPHSPAPTPSRDTGTPAPTPRQPGGVCVPVIGVCVDGAPG